MAPDYDILIVGGGPVGAALALALRASDLEIGLLEARAPQAAESDPRPLALSHGSRLILDRLGLWEKLPAATSIERIHVSQRGGFGRVELKAADIGLPALGYVVDYGQLAVAMARALEAEGRCRVTRATASSISAGSGAAQATFDAGPDSRQASARLLVAADGGALATAPTRTRDYGQTVVTTRVACAIPHRHVAYERFTPEGPLALLPAGDRLALVWTTTPQRAQQLCELSDADFLDRLQHAFGGRLGVFSRPGARTRYPIVMKVAGRRAEPRVVAIGNAAQTLHPVAGQGFNLGLRDAWELAQTLQGLERDQIGGEAHLRAYARKRRLDRGGGIGFTDSLVRLFSNDVASLKLARGAGLALLGALPPVRDFVARRMTFGTRG